MRAVIQRVKSASVSVDQQIISSIGKGICVLVGITKEDTNEDVDYIVRKIVNTRLFDDETKNRKWDLSVKDAQHEILSISQFTLYSIFKGNKLDFHNAMESDRSKEFYEQFLQKLKGVYQSDRIKDGQFGAYMDVNIVNDGPVTITVDSRNRS